jgi:hypothetical protein
MLRAPEYALIQETSIRVDRSVGHVSPWVCFNGKGNAVRSAVKKKRVTKVIMSP